MQKVVLGLNFFFISLAHKIKFKITIENNTFFEGG